MEAVLEQIEEWFRNMLIEGIMEHLTNTFDSMNSEVGEIASLTRMLRSSWQKGRRMEK